MQLEIKVYQKQNKAKFFKLLRDSLRDMYTSRFLARQLATRDIKAMYRQSFLGLFWALLTPLATALVWILLNASGTVKLTDTGMPYPIYTFAGTLIWAIISESLNSPIQSTNGSKAILSKINFPKEALILSGVYKLLFNTAIKIIILIVFLMVYQVQFSFVQLLFLVSIFGVVLFATSIGLLITPIGMLYTDITKMISLSMNFLMYITPVVYVLPKEGFLREVMLYNPFTYFIDVARSFLIGEQSVFLNMYFYLVLATIPVFFIGLVFYRISVPIFVERMNA